MATVSGTSSFTFSFPQTGPLGINPNGSIPDNDTWSFDPANGILLNQVNLKHSKTYTLAASTPQTLNLFDGSLLDIFGNACPFVRIDFLAYRIQSTNDAHIVTIGGAGANEWNGWLTNGSKVVAHPSTAANAGWTVVTAPNTTGMLVSTTSKLLKIDPGSNAVGAFDLIIVGRNA